MKDINGLLTNAKKFKDFDDKLVGYVKTKPATDAKRMFLQWVYTNTRYTYDTMGSVFNFSAPSTTLHHLRMHLKRMNESEAYRDTYAEFNNHMTKSLN
jgi:hypothetical protein